MKKQFQVFFIVFSLIFLSQSNAFLWSKTPTPSEPSDYSNALVEFEKYVKVQMALDKAPALSVGLLKDDFIWAKGFGFSDLENMVPAKPEGSFRLASITKTITAIAVLQLVEQGKIDLDAEVQTYVPYFPRKNWPVTIRYLLGHLAGISHYKNYDVEGHKKEHKNTKEAIAIFKDFDLVAEPGTKYNYSSYGFNLLGAVIEGASGESYGDYIKKHIFEPLGMTNSCMDDPAELIPNRVRGYRLIKGQIKNSEYVDVSSRFAGGGTRSTVVDLIKFAQGIIGGKLLSRGAWRQMFTSMAARNGYFTDYGMGWVVRPWKGHFQISHSGSQPETRTLLLVFPTENFAIAAASNLEGLDLFPYARKLAELILEEDLGLIAYVNKKEGQVIYDACARVFSYGMSQFDWNNGPITKDKKELSEAFSYFNTYVNSNALQKDFKGTKGKIEAGRHPISKQAFTKVGSFMAATLNDAYGSDALKSYHKKGPIYFFTDFFQITRKLASKKKQFTFTRPFNRLVSSWEKDWERVYTDSIQRLEISPHTNFEELGPHLKKSFSGINIYPDFSQDMTRAAWYHLNEKDFSATFKILNLCVELYPASPFPLTQLAAAYLWTRNIPKAKEFYKKAFAMDPWHSSVSVKAFESVARRLESERKIEELFALGEIALEFYPNNANLHKGAGDMFLKIGNIEEAIKHYKRALELNPKLKDVQKILEKIEKEQKQ
ncbi:MAG: serine hydrolase [Acidobacteriota bacterium]|nr:serine hydrolase [Acidobacteriota bacterium]